MKSVLPELIRSQRWLQVILVSLRRFEAQQRRRDAAALTYTTLFALVPVITVSYSILSAIPALQQWGSQANEQLLAYVMPEGSQAISAYLTEFSQQARQLTWVGVVFLFVTAFMLLRTIEAQFNRIWNVSQPRSGIQVFLRYWAVLSLGPLLFGLAFAASSLLASAPLWTDTAAQVPGIARLVPWGISVLALLCLYMLVPNCRVPWRHALVAALLVASLFELAKYAFARLMGLFPSYQLIYGAFAAVPLFLLWMYFSWNLLIFGAELSFGIGHVQQRGHDRQPLVVRLQALRSLLAAQQQGEPLTLVQLQQQLKHCHAATLEQFIALAGQQGWLKISEQGELCWIADLRALTLAALVQDQTVAQLNQIRTDDAALQRWLKQLQQGQQAALEQAVAGLM